MDLKELESGVDPKVHWYYQSKSVPMFKYFEKIHKQLDRELTVIDFGAGSGFFAYELLEAYPDAVKEVLLVDIGYTEAEMKATEGQIVKKMHYIPKGVNDCIVLMMDVLEHIEDDYAILEEIRDAVGENAYYFITVPAFMSLWSGHDVYLEHYRRYTLGSLKKLLKAKNCHITSHYYIYFSLFPLVWLIRQIKNIGRDKNEMPESSDMGPLPDPINAILKYFHFFEMNFRKMFKLFGITAVSEGQLK